MAFLRDSIFFYDGYFVKVPAQAVVVSVNDPRPSIRVGLEMQDMIVTEETDSSLLDPAQEATNFQAPGAARYQLNLALSTRALDSTDDSKFIELLAVRNGQILRQVKFPIYSEIEEVLARRTYDESGNYTVSAFDMSIIPSSIDSANNYTLNLTPGKAYLYGYEIENQTESKFEIPAARTTRSVNNYNINMNYGNYVVVDTFKGVFNTAGAAPVVATGPVAAGSAS